MNANNSGHGTFNSVHRNQYNQNRYNLQNNQYYTIHVAQMLTVGNAPAPQSPPPAMESAGRRAAIVCRTDALSPSHPRHVSNSSVMILHQIKRLLLDPRQPHHLICFRILRRNILILSDMLGLVENDLNGTPISPGNSKRLGIQLERVSGKLQYILNGMHFYRDALSSTPIRTLWRRVYAHSSDLEVAVEMMDRMVADLTLVCRRGSRLIVNKATTLEVTVDIQPPKPRTIATIPTTRVGKMPDTSLPAIVEISGPVEGPVYADYICETPASAVSPWSVTSPGNFAKGASSPSISPGGALSPDYAQVSLSDKVIAVMGATGVGKSTFINTVIGEELAEVSDSLESCTKDVRSFRCPHPSNNWQDVVFVDTPGFDDTYRRDTDILESIATWLNATYKRGVKLSGILYLHRLSDNRFAGTPLRNLGIFRRLCGDEALKNVILVTTMGEDLDPSVSGPRMSELKDVYWRSMIDLGSRVVSFDKKRETAWKIVDSFVRPPETLLLPREMVDEGKTLPETGAGKVLFAWLESVIRQINDMLKRLESRIRKMSKDDMNGSTTELSAQRVELADQLQSVNTQMDKLRSSSSRRLRNKIKGAVRAVRDKQKRRMTALRRGAPLDSTLAPEHRTRLLDDISLQLQRSIEMEKANPIPYVSASLRTAMEILQVVKDAGILSYTVIRLMQDLSTVFAAVVEKHGAEGLDLSDIQDIWGHLTGTLDEAKSLIVRIASVKSQEMGLPEYKVLMDCRKTVNDAYDVLEIDNGLCSITSTVTMKSI